MEALSFQHYLETQNLIPYEVANTRLANLGNPDTPVTLSLEDYILGIFDMTGELMRFAITAMATSQALPGSNVSVTSERAKSVPPEVSAKTAAETMDVDPPNSYPEANKTTRRRDVMQDLRQLRAALEGLDIEKSSPLHYGVHKKMDVMQQSVEKVEKALYGLIVRGRERPKGWMPELNDEGRRGEIESY